MFVIHIVNRKGNRLNNIFAMNVAFSNFYFVFRVFLLTHFILLPDYFQQLLFCYIFSAGVGQNLVFGQKQFAC